MQRNGLPANRIKQLREERGLERYDLSVELRVDPSTVARWETGETQMPDRQKLALARLFGVSVTYLMGWDDGGAIPIERGRTRRPGEHPDTTEQKVAA